MKQFDLSVVCLLHVHAISRCSCIMSVVYCASQTQSLMAVTRSSFDSETSNIDPHTRYHMAV